MDSTETDDAEVLRDNDMGGGHQQENGGYHGEQCEDYQAQSVQHHGSKLPITLCGPCVILIPDLLGDHPELLKDESQFPHTAGWQRSHLLLEIGKIAWGPGSNFHLTIELSIFVDSVNTFNAFLYIMHPFTFQRTVLQESEEKRKMYNFVCNQTPFESITNSPLNEL